MVLSLSPVNNNYSRLSIVYITIAYKAFHAIKGQHNLRQHVVKHLMKLLVEYWHLWHSNQCVRSYMLLLYMLTDRSGGIYTRLLLGSSSI